VSVILRFTTSDYPFGIIKLCLTNNTSESDNLHTITSVLGTDKLVSLFICWCLDPTRWLPIHMAFEDCQPSTKYAKKLDECLA